MNTTTTVATSNTSSNVNPILDALNKLKDRTDKQEIVLSEFPVMQGYSIIDKDSVMSYLSEEGKKPSSEVVAKFTGEIFDKAKLLQLSRIQADVNKTLNHYGTVVGKCCTYLIASADHHEVVSYLSSMKKKYEDIVNEMLNNYDQIVSDHVAKLMANVEDDKARAALIAKIPTKEKIASQHQAEFRFYKGYCPSEDDLQQSADEILAAVKLAEKNDLSFVEKVANLFKMFLEPSVASNTLGKRYSAFERACNTALSFERSTKLVLAGSKYETIAKAQFELLHEAKAQLISSNPSKRTKQKIAEKLADKFKQVAYVLSSSTELEAYAEGKIKVFDGADFIASAVQMVKNPSAAVNAGTFVSATADVEEQAEAEKETETADTSAVATENEAVTAMGSFDELSIDDLLEDTESTEVNADPVAPATPVAPVVKEMTKEEKLENLEQALAELLGTTSTADSNQEAETADTVVTPEQIENANSVDDYLF